MAAGGGERPRDVAGVRRQPARGGRCGALYGPLMRSRRTPVATAAPVQGLEYGPGQMRPWGGDPLAARPSRHRGSHSTMNEIYVSTDVEVDGPIPGPHSLLSLGSAAYLADKTLVAT